jgi:hypothetical protein
MKKGQLGHLRHRMTALVLLLLPLLALACCTSEEGSERTVTEQAAATPVEIVVTRDMDAQSTQPAHATNAALGDDIRLLGYDFQVAGQALNVALYWQVKEPMDRSYNVFVHVFDSQGELQGQSDSLPVSGDYPTSSWQPGEVIVDGYTIPLRANAPLDAYRVAVGMYDTATNERLPVLDGMGQVIPDSQIVLDLAVDGEG